MYFRSLLAISRIKCQRDSANEIDGYAARCILRVHCSIRLCSSGRRVHWSVAVITRGPLRVRGKRSSVCPSIKKGIPKASRQIDGERAREAECERGRAREKQCCCRLPRDTRGK